LNGLTLRTPTSRRSSTSTSNSRSSRRFTSGPLIIFPVYSASSFPLTPALLSMINRVFNALRFWLEKCFDEDVAADDKQGILNLLDNFAQTKLQQEQPSLCAELKRSIAKRVTPLSQFRQTGLGRQNFFSCLFFFLFHVSRKIRKRRFEARPTRHLWNPLSQ